jgi:hypothetical protein
MIHGSKILLIASTAMLLLTSGDNSSLAEPPAIAKLDVPTSLNPKQFADYQALIKPAAHESPWAQISWHASVWEARQQAVAEGKPILIWAGGGSPPLGVC